MSLSSGESRSTSLTTTRGRAMSVRYSNPQTMHKPLGYTHVVEATGPGRLIYVSGQVGLTQAGSLAGGPTDFRGQAKQVFENLKAALADAGATFNNVLKLNVYVTDRATQLIPYREVRDLYINKSNPPASTLVEVPRLAVDGLLLEV